MTTHRSIALSAAGALVALAAGTAYAVSDHGQGAERAAEITIERSRSDAPPQQAAAHDDDAQQSSADDAANAAEVIADEFDADADDVAELHEQGMGYGVIFKLYAIADAKDMDVDDFIESLDEKPNGKPAFAYGQIKKSLDEDEAEELADGPKNLGQLVSASRKAKHGP